MVLETADEKVEQICQLLTKETLEPARQKAKDIVSEAEAQAKSIIKAAEEEAKELTEKSLAAMKGERKTFDSTIKLAHQQAITQLKDQIQQIFSEKLQASMQATTSKKENVASILSAMVEAVRKEGIKSDLKGVIPKTVKPEDLIEEMSQDVKTELQKNSIEVADIKGGAILKIEDKKLSVHMTDEAVGELLTNYISESLRDFLFVRESQ